jgi:hypothetical protein
MSDAFVGLLLIVIKCMIQNAKLVVHYPEQENWAYCQEGEVYL